MERSIHDTFDTLRGLIRVGQRTAPCASQVLYDGTDAQVLTNLTERSARTTNAAQQCYSVHNAIGAVIASGVSWSTVRPPAWMKTSPWARCVTTQQLHVLSFSLQTEDKPVLLRDVNGTHTRVRQSVIHEDGKHGTFTMLPQQVCWVFKPGQEPRLLLGEECMMLQGFPVKQVSDLVAKTPQKLLQDIAGNMVSNPVLLLLLMSAVSCLDWGNRPLARLTAVPQASGPASGPVDVVAPDPQQLDDALHATHLLVRAHKAQQAVSEPVCI